MDQKLLAVGQGYVGLPLALAAVDAGMTVVGYDIDVKKIRGISAGRSPIDDVTDDQISGALASGRYTPVSDASEVGEFDFAIITVPTPLREGNPDLSAVIAAAELIASRLTSDATVVLESTTWPGTTKEIVGPILEQRSGLTAGRDFRLGYSPERIDPGNKTWRFDNTPKVVSGIDPASLESVQGFYDQIVEQTVAVKTLEVAELTKLLENTFRHVNIALVNELAMFANELDIDIWETIDAAATKPFGFMPFRPGPGVGGHCLPIDPSYLAWRVQSTLGSTFRFVVLANDVNQGMPDYVVTRLTSALNDHRLAVNGSKILVLGVAYKPNSADTRESPAFPILEKLGALGADLRVADPHVDHSFELPRGRWVDATKEEASDADAVLLLVDHSDFDIDGLAQSTTLFFDTKRCSDASSAIHL